MATRNDPSPHIFQAYPTSAPVSRWQGPGTTPPVVAPKPGPFQAAKTAMPALPPVFALFHTPQRPGNRGQ